jgi:uncharacterized protein
MEPPIPGPAILALAARCGMENVRVFGSVARGARIADRDLDLLVAASPGRSLVDVVAFSQTDSRGS